MNEKWIYDMRQQMAGYEMQSPQGLLDDVLDSMRARRNRKRALAWVPALVAAATLALLLVNHKLQHGKQTGMPVPPAMVTAQIEPAETQPAAVPLSPAAPQQPVAQDPSAVGQHNGLVADGGPVARRVPAVRQSAEPAEPATTAVPQKAVAEATAQQPAAQTAQQPVAQEVRQASKQPAPATVADPVGGNEATARQPVAQAAEKQQSAEKQRTEKQQAPAKEKAATRKAVDERRPQAGRTYAQAGIGRTRRGIALGVYADGTALSGLDLSRGDADFMETVDPSYGEDLGLINNTYTHIDARHKQPIKVGLNVAVPVARKWSVETGLFYSYHHADIDGARDGRSVHVGQNLHYVGIPLNVIYHIWQRKRLSVYASGGGAVETMVDGVQKSNTQSEKVTDHRLQFSVGARAGVEYRFANKLGVYFEPGANYYIDNHSRIPTFYSDRPLNVELKVGLRFNTK